MLWPSRWCSGKWSACQAGDAGDMGLIPGSGRSPGEGNPMDRGAWWVTVQGVTKSQTWLSDWTYVGEIGCPCGDKKDSLMSTCHQKQKSTWSITGSLWQPSWPRYEFSWNTANKHVEKVVISSDSDFVITKINTIFFQFLEYLSFYLVYMWNIGHVLVTDATHIHWHCP